MAECRQVRFQGTPNYLVVDVCVAVDQAVTKRDDPLTIADVYSKGCVSFEHLIEGFSDDFELGFYSGSQHDTATSAPVRQPAENMDCGSPAARRDPPGDQTFFGVPP